MSINTCFIVPEEGRIAFINENIVGKLPENVRDSARDRATKIVLSYAGQDLNALSVLAYAAEQGRFDEFAVKLEGHYQDNLQFVHPEARRHPLIPGAMRTELFFLDCYKAMGIKPQ